MRSLTRRTTRLSSSVAPNAGAAVEAVQTARPKTSRKLRIGSRGSRGIRACIGEREIVGIDLKIVAGARAGNQCRELAVLPLAQQGRAHVAGDLLERQGLGRQALRHLEDEQAVLNLH